MVLVGIEGAAMVAISGVSLVSGRLLSKHSSRLPEIPPYTNDNLSKCESNEKAKQKTVIRKRKCYGLEEGDGCRYAS